MISKCCSTGNNRTSFVKLWSKSAFNVVVLPLSSDFQRGISGRKNRRKINTSYFDLALQPEMSRNHRN